MGKNSAQHRIKCFKEWFEGVKREGYKPPKKKQNRWDQDEDKELLIRKF
jgi:hypothetical protein